MVLQNVVVPTGYDRLLEARVENRLGYPNSFGRGANGSLCNEKRDSIIIIWFYKPL